MWIMKYSRTVHSCPDMASSVMHRMKNHFPLKPRKLLDLFCHERTLLPSARNFTSFSAKLLSSLLAPAYNWHKRLFHPRGKTWHFAFTELHKVSFFSLQHGNMFLTSSTILWYISHSSWLLYQLQTCGVQFSVPSLRSGTKMFSDTGHKRNPWCTLLVPGLQLDVMMLTTILVYGPSRLDSFQPMSPSIYFFRTLKDWVGIDYGILSKVSHKVKINDTCCSSFIPHGHHISPQKAITLVKSVFSFINQLWLLPIIFLSILCLESVSGRIFSITFPRTEVRLTCL